MKWWNKKASMAIQTTRSSENNVHLWLCCLCVCGCDVICCVNLAFHFLKSKENNKYEIWYFVQLDVCIYRGKPFDSLILFPSVTLYLIIRLFVCLFVCLSGCRFGSSPFVIIVMFIYVEFVKSLCMNKLYRLCI